MSRSSAPPSRARIASRSAAAAANARPSASRTGSLVTSLTTNKSGTTERSESGTVSPGAIASRSAPSCRYADVARSTSSTGHAAASASARTTISIRPREKRSRASISTCAPSSGSSTCTLPRGSAAPSPEPNPVIDFMLSGEASLALHDLDHARVFDVPLARAFLHVLELRAHLGVELVVLAHVLLEDRRHLAAELDVLRVDFVDVLGVAEHFDDLIE